MDEEYPTERRNETTELDISKGKVKKLVVHDRTLKGDLKLEGFINLRKLIISSHQITSLDVSGCPNLEELDCQNNEISSLNLSGFRYLSKVDCSNNNIKELGVSGCAELKEINCDFNKFLKEIDVSNCSNLATVGSEFTHDKGKGKLIRNVSEIVPVGENDVRNILIVGTTGGGKSTLANVLLGSSKFEERDSTTSVTSSFQKSDVFEWEKDGKKVKYRVIDNVGFGDTNSLTTMDILHEIGKGIYSAKNKINQVLFVIDGRFSPEQINAFNLFRNFISESRITEFTTLVRTKFTNFRNQEKYLEDKEDLLKESQELKNIIGSCNDFIYVDNPPIPEIEDEDSEGEKENKKSGISISKNKRKKSREIVLDHLVDKCRKIYKLKEWESIHDQVIEHIKKVEKKQKELSKTNSGSEKDKLQNEIKKEREKFAEEINVTLGIKVGLTPELNAQVEFKDIKCCLIF